MGQFINMAENALSIIRSALPTECGIENTLQVTPVPMRLAEDIISSLTKQSFYIEETNGCDMDWSSIDNILIDNKEYSVWGSARDGSICFQLIK